jgi:hypothetical protein
MMNTYRDAREHAAVVPARGPQPRDVRIQLRILIGNAPGAAVARGDHAEAVSNPQRHQSRRIRKAAAALAQLFNGAVEIRRQVSPDIGLTVGGEERAIVRAEGKPDVGDFAGEEAVGVLLV